MPTCCWAWSAFLTSGSDDVDLVVAGALDLRLGDAEAVDALAHDVDRAVEASGVTLLNFVGLAW